MLKDQTQIYCRLKKLEEKSDYPVFVVNLVKYRHYFIARSFGSIAAQAVILLKMETE